MEHQAPACYPAPEVLREHWDEGRAQLAEWLVGVWGVSPEETTGQGWKMDVTVGKEEAASGLTPGGGDRTAGTRVPEEGGTRQAELSPESLAEAGMQASEVVSRHGDEGKIRTGRGGWRESETIWVRADTELGWHCPCWPSGALPGPRAAGTED